MHLEKWNRFILIVLLCFLQKTNAEITCSPDERKCVNGSECILTSWWCDQDPDCDDESDETHCECAFDNKGNPQHRCQTQAGTYDCVPKCDDHADCVDRSDEQNCGNGTSTKFVTWRQYWISTGILLFFVSLLLAATTFLLCQHYRRSPMPVPKAEPNSYVHQNPSTILSEETGDDQTTQQSIRPPISIPQNMANRSPQPIPTSKTINSQRPHRFENPETTKSPTNINQPRHGKPVPLPKPAPSTLSRGPRQASQIRLSNLNPTTPPSAPPLRSRSPTANSSDGYDNDPPEPDLPPSAPDLPPPNPPPRQQQQPIYANQNDEDSYYEEPKITTYDENQDNLYNDVDL